MTNDSKRSSADRRLATAAGTAVAKTAVATAAAIAVVVAIVVVAVGYVVAVGSADMRVVAEGAVVATGDDVAVEWALARFPRDARSWAWAMSALVDDAPPEVRSLRYNRVQGGKETTC